MGWHKNGPDQLSVSLFAKGGEVRVKQLKAWEMKSIYTQ